MPHCMNLHMQHTASTAQSASLGARVAPRTSPQISCITVTPALTCTP
jgi:hypothetical protein